MTQKRFCNGPKCGEEINEHKGFFTLESQYKERDYGMIIPGKGADFCSLRCLIAYAIEKRMSAVVREERIEKDGQKTILYSWEGVQLSSEEVEKREGKFHLTEEAYAKHW